jgi:hypothetical protein
MRSTIATSSRGDGEGVSASIVDVVLFVVNNYQALGRAASSLVLYLPRVQTAEEAASGTRSSPRSKITPGCRSARSGPPSSSSRSSS